MRSFFLFVLLINLLAFAYQSWIIEPDVSVMATHLDQRVPELVLVAPAPPAVQASAGDQAVAEDVRSDEPADAPSEPQEAAPAYRCLRIGPLPRETDADAVRLALRQKQATVRQTAEPGRVWVGYWVQTGAHASRSQAEDARKILNNNGMSDVYILPDNEQFRISLGVFRLRSSADGVVEQARKLGFDTRVVERYQPGTNFWLLVRIPADRSLQSGELPSVPGQILRTEATPCEEAGV